MGGVTCRRAIEPNMDGDRFDQWTRTLARTTTRRRLGGLFSGVVLIALPGTMRGTLSAVNGVARAAPAAAATATPTCVLPIATDPRNVVTGTCDDFTAAIDDDGVWFGGNPDPTHPAVAPANFDFVVLTKSAPAGAQQISYKVIKKPKGVCITTEAIKVKFTLDPKIVALTWRPSHPLSSACAKEKQRFEQQVCVHELGHVQLARDTFKKSASKRKPWEGWKSYTRCGATPRDALLKLYAEIQKVVDGMEIAYGKTTGPYHAKVGAEVKKPQCAYCCNDGREPCGEPPVCCRDNEVCDEGDCLPAKPKSAAAPALLPITIPANPDETWGPSVPDRMPAGWVEVVIDNKVDLDSEGLPTLLCLTARAPGVSCGIGQCAFSVGQILRSAGADGFSGCWWVPDGGVCDTIVRVTPGSWVIGTMMTTESEDEIAYLVPSTFAADPGEDVSAPATDQSITFSSTSVIGLPAEARSGRQLWSVTYSGGAGDLLGGKAALLTISAGLRTAGPNFSACSVLLLQGRTALLVLDLQPGVYTIQVNFAPVATVQVVEA